MLVSVTLLAVPLKGTGYPLVIGPSLLVPGKPLEPLTAFGNVTPSVHHTESSVKPEKKQKRWKKKKKRQTLHLQYSTHAVI
jgi:hypothetical protein